MTFAKTDGGAYVNLAYATRIVPRDGGGYILHYPNGTSEGTADAAGDISRALGIARQEKLPPPPPPPPVPLDTRPLGISGKRRNR